MGVVDSPSSGRNADLPGHLEFLGRAEYINGGGRDDNKQYELKTQSSQASTQLPPTSSGTIASTLGSMQSGNVGSEGGVKTKKFFKTGDDVIGPEVTGNLEPYQLITTLQTALFGAVYEAVGKNSGQKRAIKVLHKKELERQPTSETFCEVPLSEIKFRREMLGHENIVEVVEHFENSHCHFIVFDLAERGDLLEALKLKPHGFSEMCVRVLMRDAARGMAELHRRHLALQDVSLENLLIFVSPTENNKNNKITIKLCDPGQAVRFSTDENGHELPVPFAGQVGKSFRPPELCDRSGRPYLSTKVDSWCLGWSTWYLVAALPLFLAALDSDVDYCLFRNGDLPALFKRKGGFDQKLSPLCMDFILSLLQLNPTDRLSIEQALDHPFLCGADLPPYLTAEDMDVVERKSRKYPSMKRRPQDTLNAGSAGFSGGVTSCTAGTSGFSGGFNLNPNSSTLGNGLKNTNTLSTGTFSTGIIPGTFSTGIPGSIQSSKRNTLSAQSNSNAANGGHGGISSGKNQQRHTMHGNASSNANVSHATTMPISAAQSSAQSAAHSKVASGKSTRDSSLLKNRSSNLRSNLRESSLLRAGNFGNQVPAFSPQLIDMTGGILAAPPAAFSASSVPTGGTASTGFPPNYSTSAAAQIAAINAKSEQQGEQQQSNVPTQISSGSRNGKDTIGSNIPRTLCSANSLNTVNLKLDSVTSLKDQNAQNPDSNPTLSALEAIDRTSAYEPTILSNMPTNICSTNMPPTMPTNSDMGTTVNIPTLRSVLAVGCTIAGKKSRASSQDLGLNRKSAGLFATNSYGTSTRSGVSTVVPPSGMTNATSIGNMQSLTSMGGMGDISGTITATNSLANMKNKGGSSQIPQAIPMTSKDFGVKEFNVKDFAMKDFTTHMKDITSVQRLGSEGTAIAPAISSGVQTASGVGSSGVGVSTSANLFSNNLLSNNLRASSQGRSNLYPGLSSGTLGSKFSGLLSSISPEQQEAEEVQQTKVYTPLISKERVPFDSNPKTNGSNSSTNIGYSLLSGGLKQKEKDQDSKSRSTKTRSSKNEDSKPKKENQKEKRNSSETPFIKLNFGNFGTNGLNLNGSTNGRTSNSSANGKNSGIMSIGVNKSHSQTPAQNRRFLCSGSSLFKGQIGLGQGQQMNLLGEPSDEPMQSKVEPFERNTSAIPKVRSSASNAFLSGNGNAPPTMMKIHPPSTERAAPKPGGTSSGASTTRPPIIFPYRGTTKFEDGRSPRFPSPMLGRLGTQMSTTSQTRPGLRSQSPCIRTPMIGGFNIGTGKNLSGTASGGGSANTTEIGANSAVGINTVNPAPGMILGSAFTSSATSAFSTGLLSARNSNSSKENSKEPTPSPAPSMLMRGLQQSRGGSQTLHQPLIPSVGAFSRQSPPSMSRSSNQQSPAQDPRAQNVQQMQNNGMQQQQQQLQQMSMSSVGQNNSGSQAQQPNSGAVFHSGSLEPSSNHGQQQQNTFANMIKHSASNSVLRTSFTDGTQKQEEQGPPRSIQHAPPPIRGIGTSFTSNLRTMSPMVGRLGGSRSPMPQSRFPALNTGNALNTGSALNTGTLNSGVRSPLMFGAGGLGSGSGCIPGGMSSGNSGQSTVGQPAPPPTNTTSPLSKPHVNGYEAFLSKNNFGGNTLGTKTFNLVGNNTPNPIITNANVTNLSTATKNQKNNHSALTNQPSTNCVAPTAQKNDGGHQTMGSANQSMTSTNQNNGCQMNTSCLSGSCSVMASLDPIPASPIKKGVCRRGRI